MSTTPDKLVERYLKHLEIDEIAGHITQARADLEHETEADVRNILEGLGDPADIAADARERFEVQVPATTSAPFKPGALETAALILLLVGGLIIPVFGWLIGVVLLWVSNAWNVRDKIIGTIFVPGGIGVPVALLFIAGSVGASTPFLAIAAVVALLLAPIVTTAYLAYRMRKHPEATA